MTIRGSFSLLESQRNGARKAAAEARSFVEQAGYPLGVAMIDHAWNVRPAESVVERLAAYQNDDGGFGRGLEVDIASLASNPFAARLAMTILLGLKGGGNAKSDLETALQQWLVINQAEDGDWHFSEQTKAGALAPWFAGWSFPSLNPACCVAALANRLGIATPLLLARVAHLFDVQASLDAACTGDFYGLLPYTEYVGGTSATRTCRPLPQTSLARSKLARMRTPGTSGCTSSAAVRTWPRGFRPRCCQARWIDFFQSKVVTAVGRTPTTTPGGRTSPLSRASPSPASGTASDATLQR